MFCMLELQYYIIKLAELVLPIFFSVCQQKVRNYPGQHPLYQPIDIDVTNDIITARS